MEANGEFFGDDPGKYGPFFAGNAEGCATLGKQYLDLAKGKKGCVGLGSLSSYGEVEKFSSSVTEGDVECDRNRIGDEFFGRWVFGRREWEKPIDCVEYCCGC
jgi:hypothetical protein